MMEHFSTIDCVETMQRHKDLLVLLYSGLSNISLWPTPGSHDLGLSMKRRLVG